MSHICDLCFNLGWDQEDSVAALHRGDGSWWMAAEQDMCKYYPKVNFVKSWRYCSRHFLSGSQSSPSTKWSDENFPGVDPDVDQNTDKWVPFKRAKRDRSSSEVDAGRIAALEESLKRARMKSEALRAELTQLREAMPNAADSLRIHVGPGGSLDWLGLPDDAVGQRLFQLVRAEPPKTCPTGQDVPRPPCTPYPFHH